MCLPIILTKFFRTTVLHTTPSDCCCLFFILKTCFCFWYFLNLFRYVSVRSNHRRWSVKKSVLRNFAKFRGKLMCQSLFSNNVACLETLAQVFFCDFCEISKNTSFTEHLPTTAIVLSPFVIICIYDFSIFTF